MPRILDRSRATGSRSSGQGSGPSRRGRNCSAELTLDSASTIDVLVEMTSRQRELAFFGRRARRAPDLGAWTLRFSVLARTCWQLSLEYCPEPQDRERAAGHERRAYFRCKTMPSP